MEEIRAILNITIGQIIMAVSIFGIYFFPLIVAGYRHKNDDIMEKIFIFNFFLGWTLIGWVITLVWAMKDDTETTTLTGAQWAQQMKKAREADELKKLSKPKGK